MDRETFFLETLKKQKLRVTEARKAVFHVLADSDKSMSAQSVFSEIQEGAKVKTDRVSVYRNLNLFSDLGLVHRFPGGRYSICAHDHEDHGRGHGHNHIHVVGSCSTCGNVYELNAHDKTVCGAMNTLTSEMPMFSNVSSVTLQGLCNECG